MGLDTVELLLEVEDEFSVRIPDADAESIRTVDELAQLVVKLISEENKPELHREAVLEKLGEILIDKFAVDEAAITPNARIVKDLGLD